MQKRLLLGLSLVIACSGCDKKAEGQTVAVVNNEEITASELNAELANANITSEADKKQVTARVLQGIIDRRLMAEQAKKDGIDRSPDYITRQRRMNEDLLIGMLASRQVESSKLPSAGEIAAFQASRAHAFANREIWKLQQIVYQTPADQATRDRILQTKTLDQLAAVLTEKRVPFQRANNQVVTSMVPHELYPRLAALPPGEPFIVPNGARSVASAIVGRQPAPLTGAPARTEAVNMLRRENSSKLLEQRLKDLRTSAKIEYKEGFAPPK
jgi:EpsD family peptidyl-prolyl cis-trans isomerase